MQILQYEGNYDDYLLKSSIHKLEQDEHRGKKSSEINLQEKDKTTSGKQKTTKLKMSYKEQREFETIEDEIAELEEQLVRIELDIAKFATDFGKLNAVMKEKEETELQLEEKMERWVYLNDLQEAIQNQ
jgi:ATP-binding cassette subfamily F protein uup